MNLGWIKLYRQSIESRVFQNPHLWQLWCYCLLRANHASTCVPVTTGRGRTEVLLKAGQFISGSKSVAKDLKQKWQTTYKRLQKLEMMGNITIQSKTHFSIVTICNWGTYQNSVLEVENPNGNSSKTQVETKGKPSRTDKNDKNVNNDKERVGFTDEFEDFWKEYPRGEGKKPAFVAWSKLNPTAELHKLLVSKVQEFRESIWKSKEMKYIPMAATFLDQRRWEDEVKKEIEEPLINYAELEIKRMLEEKQNKISKGN